MPATGPLTSAQRQRLAHIARRAWTHARDRGHTHDDPDTWRHGQVLQAVGLPGLRQLTQQHFRAVRGHFLQLLGHHRPALSDIIASAGEGHRQALFILTRECKARSLPLAYPAAIARTQFQNPHLNELTEKQLWCLIYTIRNRRKANRP